MKQSDIDNWFEYHSPTPQQLKDYNAIRTAGKIFAETINNHVPDSADKTATIRKLRETVMSANAAIACYVPSDPCYPGVRCTCKDTYEVGSGNKCPIHNK